MMRQQAVNTVNLDNLPKTHRDVFKPYNNPMGERYAVDFLNFLNK